MLTVAVVAGAEAIAAVGVLIVAAVAGAEAIAAVAGAVVGGGSDTGAGGPIWLGGV